MTAHPPKTASPAFSELVVVLVAGISCAGLFRAVQALVQLLSILECAGAIGGTRGSSTS